MEAFKTSDNSELLCAFLDGELESTQADTLFLALAQSPDLQTEMAQQLKLRNSIQSGQVEPPARLKTKILAQTGLSVAAGTSFLASSAAYLQSRGLPMLSSAILASIVTALVVSVPSPENQQPALSDSPVQASSLTHVQEAQAASNIQMPTANEAAPLASTAQQTNDSRAPRQSDVSPSTGLDTEPASRPAFSETSVAETEPATVENSDQVSTATPIDETQALASAVTESDIQQHAEHSAYRTLQIPAVNYRSEISTAPPMPAPVAASATSPLSGLKLQLRGFTTRSVPNLDLASAADPTLNNMGIALLYPLDRGTQIGIEIGQESFMQDFIEKDGPLNLRHEQNYLAFWAGAFYQYSVDQIDFLGGLTPFARYFAGGTKVGPLSRLMVGAELSINERLSFLLSAEGTLLLYRSQEDWYTTRKVGLSYGLSFNF